MFAGAVARTVLCYITAQTVASGPDFGEYMKDSIKNSFLFNPDKIKNKSKMEEA
mgnify:CR=1 FL=1